MRYVTLKKLGTPRDQGVSITIPYNGDEFEFLDPEWRGLARRAAATEGGQAREGNRVAIIEVEEIILSL
jgi:hypothetical protein